MSIFEECDQSSIQSHTISASNLRLLAEKGHVTSLNIPKSYNPSSAINFKELSIKKASTFPGFCNEHDCRIFGPIDTVNINFANEQVTLLMFRSFVQEAYKKIKGTALTDSFQLEKGQDAEKERKQTVAGFESGTRGLLVQAKHLYDNYKQGNVYIKTVSIEYKNTLPFCFLVPVNFEIKPSYGNKDPRQNTPYESCLLGLLPTSSGSKFFISFPPSQGRYVSNFLGRLGYDCQAFPQQILQLALETCEGTYFKTSWIDSLAKNDKETLIKIFLSDLSCMDVLAFKQINNELITMPDRPLIKSNSMYGRRWKSRVK